jgi:hypothetical protein
VLTQLLNSVADAEINREPCDYCLLEVWCREGYQLKHLSEFVTNVENQHRRHEKHEEQHPLQLGIFADGLHVGSSAVINKDHSRLEPPLVDEHHTVFKVWFEL